MNIRKIIIPAFIVCLSLVVSMVLMNTKSEPLKNAVSSKKLVVETQKFEAKEVQFFVTSQGTVAPKTHTQLLSQVSGEIINISPRFSTGEFFKKGDVLLEVDPTEYEVAISQAEAKLASASAALMQEKSNVEQAKFEWSLSGKPEEEAPIIALRTPFLIEAKAAVRSAKADLEHALFFLSKTKIVAPYDGVVYLKSADVGQYIAKGTSLGEIFSTDSIEIRLPVTDRDLAFLKSPETQKQLLEPYTTKAKIIGQYGGKSVEWQGEIVRFEAQLDPTSREHFIVVEIKDPYRLANRMSGPPLKVGSFVEAEIAGLSFADVYVLPRELLRGKNKVVVVDSEKRIQIRGVNVLKVDDYHAYISQGLLESDHVSIRANSPVSEGELVELKLQSAIR